jgi:hypothetical protein
MPFLKPQSFPTISLLFIDFGLKSSILWVDLENSITGETVEKL